MFKIEDMISLVKGKHTLLEPIYCGVIILVKKNGIKMRMILDYLIMKKQYNATFMDLIIFRLVSWKA